MNFTFDKANNNIVVDEVPEGANKMVLTIPQYDKIGTPDMEQKRWVHTATILLTGTLQAIKVEEVTELVNDVDSVTNEPISYEQTKTVETVLESQQVDLKVL